METIQDMINRTKLSNPAVAKVMKLAVSLKKENDKLKEENFQLLKELEKYKPQFNKKGEQIYPFNYSLSDKPDFPQI